MASLSPIEWVYIAWSSHGGMIHMIPTLPIHRDFVMTFYLFLAIGYNSFLIYTTTCPWNIHGIWPYIKNILCFKNKPPIILWCSMLFRDVCNGG